MNVNKMLKTGVACSILAGLASATLTRADVVLEWNEALLSATRASKLNPPVFSRSAAILHGAIFDAVNGITRTHHSYAKSGVAPEGASAEAAVASAAFTIAFALFPTADLQSTNFTPLYIRQLAAIPDGPAKSDGANWGAQAADAILRARANDGATAVVTYTNTPAPGIWRPTPPANADPLLPGWGQVKPFALVSGSQFRTHQPPSLTGSAYAFEYEITRQIGSKTNSLRTADQTEIALFWADGGGTETPPGHWNHIAQIVSRERNLTLAENARMFALLNFALADAAISCWDEKFTYNLWRPITAIREADTDGNATTIADPTWEPLIVTPPFPEYTSGHSSFSRSAATVLAAVFGTNDIPITVGSDGLPGVTRSFPGFSAAADESGISRIYGGIHWPSGNLVGQTVGHRIGSHVLDFYLTPLNSTVFALIKVAGEKAELVMKGDAGRSYLIQGSPDLKTWTDVVTAVAVNGELRAEDTSGLPLRFYRALPTDLSR